MFIYLFIYLFISLQITYLNIHFPVNSEESKFIMGDDQKGNFLFVFDFDLTMINRNTDGEIIKVHNKLKNSLPAKSCIEKNAGWSQTMTYALKELYRNKILKSNIDEIILNIPLTAGFVDVFDVLRKHAGKYDCIILSHSNKYFIDILLEKYGIKDIFNIIYTYDCEWVNSNNQLVVKPFDEPLNSCNICPVDFCKGKCIKAHLNSIEAKKSTLYDSVVYIGDGTADYCAALQLSKSDFVLVRKGYSLQKRIESSGDSLEARYILWEFGSEIANFMIEMMGSRN